ncbi:MAG: polyprenol monophosphomannose synthase [Muribaculaceae bacterium]|jgi:dolichol-phosphate mannosyltransferase|nr:polyprenol monophosphomannose synthase [Muribaculaceae bacterium]
MKSDSIVIIPTYNEKENIRAIIAAVLALEEHQFDVLIVDDNSPDGTGAIVDEIIAEQPERVHILKRAGKQGLGTAYIAGFKWALERDYEYITEMDADFSHPVDKLPELQRTCASGDADVAVGSRYISGVNVVNWPMGRMLMSYYASAYVRLVTGMKVRDATAGFVCYRREVLQSIDLDAIEFKGYAFQIEMKFTAHRMGFTIKEVPIVFINRVLGTSKMNSSIFFEALWGVIKLRWDSIFNKKRFQRRPLPSAKPQPSEPSTEGA